MVFSLSSCEMYTYATTQDDIYVEADVDVVRSNVSFDVVIRYGVPYYMDGVLLYYLYNDIYYYPFYYNNYWYVRAYRRPFTHFDHRPYFRPHRYDYKFSPGRYRGYDRPNNSNFRNIRPNNHRNDGYRRPHGSRPDILPNRPNNNHPNVQPNRPNNNRPNVRNNRQRNFGGRR